MIPTSTKHYEDHNVHMKVDIFTHIPLKCSIQIHLDRPFFGPQIKRDRERQHAYFIKIAIYGGLQILFPFFGRVMSFWGAAGEKFLSFGRHKTI